MPNRSTTTRRAAALGLCAAGALALGACSTDYGAGTTDLIEGELADQIGLGPLSATCTVGDGDVEVGTSFPCSATTEDGGVIEMTATVSAEDFVDVSTDNVVLGSDLPLIESIAAEYIAEQAGLRLPAENIDCGDASLIVAEGATIECALTDPTNGDVYDTTLSNIELTEDDGIFFDIAVADQPRS